MAESAVAHRHACKAWIAPTPSRARRVRKRLLVTQSGQRRRACTSSPKSAAEQLDAHHGYICSGETARQDGGWQSIWRVEHPCVHLSCLRASSHVHRATTHETGVNGAMLPHTCRGTLHAETRVFQSAASSHFRVGPFRALLPDRNDHTRCRKPTCFRPKRGMPSDTACQRQQVRMVG